ncbi:MAG TPA: ABC transporter permease, partial [Vicinamibacterales bacterium]|nr:ABC transporter permease [Vicinamibacterales bacterium]
MRGPLFLRVLIARIRAWFRRDVVAGEIKEELEFHLAARVTEYERAGLQRDEARRRARTRIGNIAVHADRGYDIRGGGVMETIVQDIRQGMRLLRRQPGFAAIAILTIALAIGASTAVFSVIDAALLRPLPYPQPEQLMKVDLQVRTPDRKIDGATPSIEDVRRWAAAGGSAVTHVAISRADVPDRVIETGTPERVAVSNVTEDYLPMHGVRALHGRTFTAADLAPGAPKVIVLGFGFWRSRLAADPSVVGRSVRFDGQPVTIVGVLSPFKTSVAIWRPLESPADESELRNRGWDVIARLRPDVSAAEANDRLTAVTRAARPEDAATTVQLSSMLDEVSADYTITVTIIASAVGVVLLIACVNVGGLLLARGATRRQELAVRASMGAGRWRLARQLLTESLVLAVIGGAAGMLIASLSINVIAANIPIQLQDDAPATVNGAVLAASAALTMLTGLMFGGWPALRLSRVRVSPTIAREGRDSVTPLSRRGGQILIAAEIALAVVLLAGAGLMLRSFARILDVDLGFDPSKFLAMETSILDQDPAAQAAFYPALIDAVKQQPGVTDAGAIDLMPLGEMLMVSFADVVGGKKGLDIFPHQVTPGVFKALGIRLRQGRFIEPADMTAKERVAVVSETG